MYLSFATESPSQTFEELFLSIFKEKYFRLLRILTQFFPRNYWYVSYKRQFASFLTSSKETFKIHNLYIPMYYKSGMRKVSYL